MPFERRISFNWGSEFCTDPIMLKRQMLRAGMDDLVKLFDGKANSFTLPLGPSAGRGYVLLRRSQLDQINLDIAQPLEMATSTKSLFFAETYFIGALRIVHGKEADPNSVYLVEFADRRHILERFTATNKQYNLLRPDALAASATKYYKATLNSGSSWTWQGIIDDLWTDLGGLAGDTAPSLPSTPANEPNDFSFVGVSAWSAINAVADAAGCAFALDPTENTFSLVQIGEQEDFSEVDGKFSQIRDKLIYDCDVVDGYVGRVPKSVRVFFHRVTGKVGSEDDEATAQDNSLTEPAYTIDKTVPDVDDDVTLAGTIMPVWSDAVAVFKTTDSTTPTNESTLQTRATEIAQEFADSAVLVGLRIWRKYTGIIDTILPGANVTAVRWEGIGNGFVTEIVAQETLIDLSVGWPLPAIHMASQANVNPPMKPRPRWPFRVAKGTLSGALADGGSATMAVKTFADASAGVDLTVYDWLGLTESLASGSKVLAYWDDEAGKWIAFAATSPECP
ncbi:MAG: hypothetical protein A3E01_02665 [Gammaproteobacteria bacterium RIFCSPHIGHO2_12_FULL_63_22]|nr:MAG: hypothetical protein A3E01_02665 [Gammaproteobacteria bacterium RIFCSPHIGHO2_12_FULL_63_22]